MVQRHSFFSVAIILLAWSGPAAAQQFVVDDAGAGERGACQLEAWTGESSSWLLPACHVLPRTELTVGAGFVPEDDGRAWEWVVQAKVSLRDMETRPAGVSVVVGIGMDPIGQVVNSRVSGAYAYVPVSLQFGAERVVLHGNAGWSFERDGEHHGDHGHPGDTAGQHALTWGLRSDLALVPRLTFITEVFGEERAQPQFQVGIRAAVLPDRLGVDLSWGGHTARGRSGAGWTIGAAWTPRPLF